MCIPHRCSNTTYQQNGDDSVRKISKNKTKSDLKTLPPLIPKPMQDWINGNLNGSLTNGNHPEGVNFNGSNGDVIEVDPWACSINEQNHNEDSELQPSQSKLRKLLSEHQV